MATDRTPSHSSSAATNAPVYSGDARTGVYTAEFPNGARVAAHASRARSYPGISSTAPSTTPFYAAVQGLNLVGPVLDAGAGSGEGSRALRDAGCEVIAVELDRQAAQFVREYAPNVRVIEADLCTDVPVKDVAAAVVADTLGHVGDPEAFLRNVRRCLADSGTLLVAEPLAQIAQRLIAPARRAFTKQELAAMLTRTGFAIEGWLSTSGTFIACVARRIEDPALVVLDEAGTLAAAGKFREARELLAATRTQRSALALELLLAQGELALAERAGDLAAKAFFHARELEPSDARALTGLARIALSIDECQDALRLAKEAVRAEPASALVAAMLAIVDERLESADAFNAWRAAVNLAPDDVGLVTALGRVAAMRGEYHYAICAFDHARAYGDDLGPDFHVTLGWLLLADGRRQDAALEARHAQALAPEDESAKELLAAAQASHIE
jgi:tetratricopeptide (TPR) repeat protein